MVSVYDKAKYHYDGDFPEDIKIEQAFVHTGMFLGWIIDHQLFSHDFEEEAQIEIQKFYRRELTGTQIYMNWDGVLASDMLNDEGNQFAQAYFDFDTGHYLDDYQDTFPDVETLYHVIDNWENYQKLKEIMDERYVDWQKENR